VLAEQKAVDFGFRNWLRTGFRHQNHRVTKPLSNKGRVRCRT
jgi:hypothetical protein